MEGDKSTVDAALQLPSMQDRKHNKFSPPQWKRRGDLDSRSDLPPSQATTVIARTSPLHKPQDPCPEPSRGRQLRDTFRVATTNSRRFRKKACEDADRERPRLTL